MNNRMRRRLGLLVALGLLTVVVLLAIGDTRATLAALAQADWGLVMLAVFIHYSGFGVRIHRWQRLLSMLGYKLPYMYLGRVLLGGWFASALLPARAGDALRVGLLYSPPSGEHGVPPAEAAASLVSERVLDLSAILLLGAGFGWALLGSEAPPWLFSIYTIGIGVLAVLAVALLVMPSLLERLRRGMRSTFWLAILNFVTNSVQSVRRLMRQPVPALLLLLESLYIWLCDALLLWLVLASLDRPLPFSAAAFAALTADVFASVPLTPGALGQIESAYAALLALLRMPVAGIPAAVLLMRAITYWTFLLVTGLIALHIGLDRLLRLPSVAKPAPVQASLGTLGTNAPAEPPS